MFFFHLVFFINLKVSKIGKPVKETMKIAEIIEKLDMCDCKRNLSRNPKRPI